MIRDFPEWLSIFYSTCGKLVNILVTMILDMFSFVIVLIVVSSCEHRCETSLRIEVYVRDLNFDCVDSDLELIF